MSGFDVIADKLAEEIDSMEERNQLAKRLLMACLDTGILRTDTYRELYEEVCKFVGIEPK